MRIPHHFFPFREIFLLALSGTLHAESQPRPPLREVVSGAEIKIAIPEAQETIQVSWWILNSGTGALYSTETLTPKSDEDFQLLLKPPLVKRETRFIVRSEGAEFLPIELAVFPPDSLSWLKKPPCLG